MGDRFKMHVALCALLLLVTAQCGTQVRVLNCLGKLQQHKINFRPHTTLGQAHEAVAVRFGLSQHESGTLQLLGPDNHPLTLGQLRTHPAHGDLHCKTPMNPSPERRLALQGAVASEGNAALFQIPLSIQDSVTGEKVSRSVVVRSGDTPESACKLFCLSHGVEDCSPLEGVARLRIQADILRVPYPAYKPSDDLTGHFITAASAFRSDQSAPPRIQGLGHPVPRTPLPPLSELPPPHLIRHFHHTAVPGLSAAWEACAAVYRNAPRPQIQDMSALWTAATAEHWERALDRSRSLDIELYHERERKDASTQTPVINWMVRQGRAEICVSNGCVWINGSHYESFASLLRDGNVPGGRTIGMAGQNSDLRTVLGNGWTARSSHLVFETERTMSSSTATDLLGTEASDNAVAELELALKAALGEGFVELRGLFLYVRHGFREFHANMYDPPGWRMYLVHKTDAASTSWFSIRDPHTRKIFDLPDSDGQINLFRVSRETPVWHAITSVDAHRWSCGVRLTDAAGEAILRQLDTSSQVRH